MKIVYDGPFLAVTTGGKTVARGESVDFPDTHAKKLLETPYWQKKAVKTQKKDDLEVQK